MKQISEELVEFILNHRPNFASWLQTVVGIGHKIEGEKGAVGFYTGENGFLLESDGVQYTVYRGLQTFSVSDADGVAAYLYLAGNISFRNMPSAAEITYPLTMTVIGASERIEAYAHALAYALTRHLAVEQVSLNHDKTANLNAAAKSNRKTRNTAAGVANISFYFTVQQGDDCLPLEAC